MRKKFPAADPQAQMTLLLESMHSDINYLIRGTHWMYSIGRIASGEKCPALNNVKFKAHV
jgi:hypothetical protein